MSSSPQARSDAEPEQLDPHGEACAKLKTIGFDYNKEQLLISEVQYMTQAELQLYYLQGDYDSIKERFNQLAAGLEQEACDRKRHADMVANCPASKRLCAEPAQEGPPVQSGRQLCKGLRLVDPPTAVGYSGTAHGRYKGRKVFVKWAHEEQATEDSEDLVIEGTALASGGLLNHMCSKSVPELLFQGHTPDRQFYVVITSFIEGKHPDHQSEEEVLKDAVEVLQKVHDAGCVHRRICSKNVIIDHQGKVFLVGWSRFITYPTDEQLEHDKKSLYEAVGRSYPGSRETSSSG